MPALCSTVFVKHNWSRPSRVSVHLTRTPQCIRPAPTSSRRRQLCVTCKVTDFSVVVYDRVVTFGFATDFKQHYDAGTLLGAGSFGTVHTAVHKVTGQRYAVKSIPKAFNGKYLKEQFVSRVLHEVDVYSHLGRSLNVAHLYGVYEDATSVSLVMELCSGGELWRRIKKGRYSEKDAARIVRQVLQSIAQCHARSVIVRDVKPENFLFLDESDDSPLKMIDFGLAEYCRVGQCLTTRVGTPMYLAPEVLRMSYSLPADVWGAGIIAYQLLAGRLPFKGEDGERFSQMGGVGYSHKELFRAILYAELDFQTPPWNTISREARALVESLLHRDPFKRPTAEQALNSCWLDDSSQVCTGGEQPLCDTLVQRLQRFGTYGKLKQVALKDVAALIPPNLDHPRIRSLQEAFSVLDSSGVGQLPYSRLVALLRENGYELSDTEVHQLLDQFDLNHDGTVDYREWIAALVDWKDLQASSEWHQWVDTVFSSWDADRSGGIGKRDLKAVLCEDECPVEDTVNAAMREADLNHDGSISRDEFDDLLHVDAKERLQMYSSRQRRSPSPPAPLATADALSTLADLPAETPPLRLPQGRALSAVLDPCLVDPESSVLPLQCGVVLNEVLEPNTMELPDSGLRQPETLLRPDGGAELNAALQPGASSGMDAALDGSLREPQLCT